MSSTMRRWMAPVAATVAMAASQLYPATALADPVTDGQPTPGQDAPQAPVDKVLHNVTYRARIDGVSRGATVSYTAEGDQTQVANPTMVPGRTFEAQTVLDSSQVANIQVSIEWPYSANLHCQILVDDAVVSQAEDFIAPRFRPHRDDPDYGMIACQAPVGGVPNLVPGDPTQPAPVDAPLPSA